MTVTIPYDDLSRVFGFSSTILSDKIVDEKMKNMIVYVKPDSVKICVYNALTFCRTEIPNAEVADLDKEEVIFQVKSNDISKIISSFASLSRTAVKNVQFTEEANKIRVSIAEEALDEGMSRLSQVSEFMLDNVPIIESIAHDIKMEFPADAEVMSSYDISLYSESLLPLMVNDSASSIGSKLNFADDYVFILTSNMSVFFKNQLPDTFKGITLGYGSVNFLLKLCAKSGGGDISVKRTDKYLCVSSESTEAFLRHQPVKIKYAQYIKRFQKELGIVLDRLYFRDVLKRVGNLYGNGVISIIDNGDICIETTEGFSQIVPVERKRGTVEGITFKISVPLIEKMIIGNDDVFPDKLFIHLVKAGT